LLVRRIRELLYSQGFTISGARNRLEDLGDASSSGESMTPESLRAELLKIAETLKV